MFGIDITEKDEAASGGAAPGHWTIEIVDGDATLHGPENRTIPLKPTELTNRRMVVPPDPGCPNNKPKPGEGVYEVSLRGERLRFTKVVDPCGDRAFTLTVRPWTREDTP